MNRDENKREKIEITQNDRSWFAHRCKPYHLFQLKSKFSFKFEIDDLDLMFVWTTEPFTEFNQVVI